jgi:hypothetical protein
MKSVTVHGKSANEIIDIVHQMKEYGWVIGVDFEYEYHKRLDYDGFYKYPYTYLISIKMNTALILL